MTKNIKDIIINKINKDRVLRTSDIVDMTGFSRVYIARLMRDLERSKIVRKVGKANNSYYVLFNSVIKMDHIRYLLNNKNLREDVVWHKLLNDYRDITSLSNNVFRILKFAFAEMLNNAIEHSGSEKISIEAGIRDGFVFFEINDTGIGIFNNILNKFKLLSIDDAIAFVLTGKKTTAESEHSGQGIFFTSRMADKFIISTNRKQLIFDNDINDKTVISYRERKGTKVSFAIRIDSDRQINDVFDKYSDGDTLKFDKTDVYIKLYEYSRDGDFVSRTEARRILIGIEDFNFITFDFKGIKSIGQAFADQIFRIFRNENINKRIEYINANEEVEFMIKRSLQD